jgi:hypothetical protein
MEPIKLRYSAIIREARQNLERAGLGPDLERRRQTRVLTRAHTLVRKSEQYAERKRVAQALGRSALIAVRQACGAYDRLCGAPSSLEREQRAAAEELLRKIAGSD